MMAKPSIMFLCTGNACRSQMAEGLMREMAGDRFEIYSAGAFPAGYVHPLAIAAMSEVGIDLSGHWSKGLDEPGARDFDYVVTVCDHARQACPLLNGRRGTFHWPLEDPVTLYQQDEEAAMAAARVVRDELKERLSGLVRDIAPRDEGQR
jgi:arsenate reductase